MRMSIHFKVSLQYFQYRKGFIPLLKPKLTKSEKASKAYFGMSSQFAKELKNYKPILILIDSLVLVLASFLAILFLSYDYDLFGLEKSPYMFPKEFKYIYDYLPWTLFL